MNTQIKEKITVNDDKLILDLVEDGIDSNTYEWRCFYGDKTRPTAAASCND